MTLEGTKIAIDTKTTPGKIEVGAPEQGTQGLAGRVDGGFVTQTDIDADNGVIHVIDGVATPKPPLIGHPALRVSLRWQLRRPTNDEGDQTFSFHGHVRWKGLFVTILGHI